MAEIRPCSGWRQPPDSPILGRDKVHVWRIPLGLPERPVAYLVPLLSREEHARAEQILCEEANRRFVVSHGATRKILSRYLDKRPEEIRFVTDAQGKPHLASPSAASAVCFSLSHSGEFALLAVTRDRDIGVDIERIRPVSAWRQIAARYFSLRENQALCSLAGDKANEAFFRCWTSKEAYAKALGEGVSQRWTQFTVSLQPGLAAEVISDTSEAQAESRFALCLLAPGPGYVGAVAAQGVEWRLSCWQWSFRKGRESDGRPRRTATSQKSS